MWEFFIKNNKFAYLCLIALIGLGSYSLLTISRESSPEITIPIGFVNTILPGAPAADVESLITNEIERGLASLENVKKITSTSQEGMSSVIVEFDASADIDASIQDLKDEVDKLKSELPNDAEDPSVSEVSFSDEPVMTIALSGDLDDFALTTISKKIEVELEKITGVSRVEFRGVRDREVTVIVDQESLKLYSLSINEVISAIRNANLTFPIGQIKNDGIAYNVAFEGDINDSSQIEYIGITTRGGQLVYVRDVAQVIDGLEPASSISRLSVENTPSQTAMTLYVYKQSGGDITSITSSVNERISQLQENNGLLSSMDSVTVLDAGSDIKKDLFRLSFSGFQTILLVVLLLVLTIGWREGLLAGIAIPLSFLFGFIGLYFSGNTINFLSLFSLILGIGILVDSAIVMVEGINKRMKDDPKIDKQEAAVLTIREFSAPLISGTLTTVSMFAGLFIVSGIIGQFIASIPFTLIFLLFASMFVSLAIIPLLASSFLRRRSDTKFERRQVELSHKFESWYRAKLDLILGHKKPERIFRWGIRIALVIALILPVAGLVKVEFFEQSDIDYAIVEIENPEGTTKEITDISVRRVEEILYTENDITAFTVTVGRGNDFGSGGTGEKLANIFINLDLDRDRTSTEIVDSLREKLTSIRDVKVTVGQPSDGPPTGAAILIKYLGDDLTEITDIANRTAAILKEIPEVIDVNTSTTNNSTEFVLELDKEKTAAAGLTPFAVSQAARSAVFGTNATSLTTLSEDIDVVVKLKVDPTSSVTSDTTNVATIEDLTRITLPSPTGDVTLSDLVTVSLRESSSVINHEEGKRVVTVTADVTAEGNSREAQIEALQLVNEQLTLSSNVEISTGGGETDESNKAFMEMFLALVVGILLMVGILTLQFNSYLHMRYVLSILPYSLIGIMAGLAITQNPLSFPSMMGFIALSGIVVNNSILLIDMMNQMRKRHPEKEIREIVLDAATNRLRPILLTTITTVIGMIPLTYAGDLWSPLAYAVMFGLVFSVLITLLLIPIIYNQKPGVVKSH
ncbi:MAG: multidrug efflux pump [Acidimicrobiales bacterium]|jgi:multidrug efflux pump